MSPLVDVNWAAIAVVALVLLSLGAATYAGFRLGHDERPPADATLRAPSSLEPDTAPSTGPDTSPSTGPDASSSIESDAPSSVEPDDTVAPAPSASATSTSPSLAATTPERATRTQTAGRKAPAWEQRVIAATSVLTTGQSWATNRLRLQVTGGGNLVLQDQGRTVWQTGTDDGVKLVMQNDGHLVLYDAGNGTAWSSGTAGNPGATLILRADGTMVIALNGRVLFRAGTAG
ncbi:hypothetical protein [Paractinoplanes maris]|uniref:hypothetical protein n=1 Tax=Paractinoplanes maris TaxID=1734446 RepID=UPI002020E34C|nr:hypothetical protein [Actinoplanes maris]